LVAVCTVAALAALALQGGRGSAHGAGSGPEFMFAPTQGVGRFDGFGVQFNQHVYANLSGPPSGLAALEDEVVRLRAPFVRIFFNTTEWTFPDRMDSFQRTVALAQRSGARINITWQGSGVPFALANMSRFADVLALAAPPVVEGNSLGNIVIAASAVPLPGEEFLRRADTGPRPIELLRDESLVSFVGDAHPRRDGDQRD